MLRFPRTRTSRILCAIVAVAAVSSVTASWLTARRWSTGRDFQLQGYMHGAAQNAAMMDAAGFESEAREARKNGDMPKYLELHTRANDASVQEKKYEALRLEAEKAALGILGKKAKELPPGIQDQMPVPIY